MNTDHFNISTTSLDRKMNGETDKTPPANSLDEDKPTGTEKKFQLGKKTVRRPKERIAFVQNSRARSCTLYKRKSTLFDKALKLHAMTKTEVLVIIDQVNGHRIVGGSKALLATYNKGELKPTETDTTYPESTTGESSPEDGNIPGVEPLENTPDKIDMDHRLAGVLGHEITTTTDDVTAAPVGRCRRRLNANEVSAVEIRAPTPVMQLLLDKPIPQISEKEKEEVPAIQKQSKIWFISDKEVAFLFNKDSTAMALTAAIL